MKRILLIDHAQYTSATYYLWQGLRELEKMYPEHLSVSCYPYIPTNYDEDRFDFRRLPWFNWLTDLVESSKRNVAELPYGIPRFHPTEHLTSQNETFIHRGFPWLKLEKKNLIEDEDSAVREFEVKGFDLVILGNSHRIPTILLGRLRERVKNFPPIIYFDAGERDELNEHWIHVFRPAVVFKQILTPEVMKKGLSLKIPDYTLRMYPLPLSSPLVDQDIQIEGLPIQWLRKNSDGSKNDSKILQVFYGLGSTWPDRAEVTRVLDGLVIKHNLSRVKNGSYLNYNYILSRSRMAVTMRGSGRDTNHYWDIPLYKTAMVSDGTMGCIHPYPFEDGKTALFYRSIKELTEVVESHLNLPGDVERIGEAGQRHLEKYHSTAARAVFFMDVLIKELNFADQGLIGALSGWKSTKQWDGRLWEGPVV